MCKPWIEEEAVNFGGVAGLFSPTRVSSDCLLSFSVRMLVERPLSGTNQGEHRSLESAIALRPCL